MVQRSLVDPTRTREAARRPGQVRASEDEVIVGAEAVDRSEAVRGLSSNDQEQAREDHQEHAGSYSRQGKVTRANAKRLDVAG